MGKKGKMNITAAFALLMMLLLAASAFLPNALGQVTPPAGTQIPTYAFLNVAPNPCGVNQTVTVNMFLLVPLLTGERPVNMTVVVKTPDKKTITLGPFTGDTTGGTWTTFTPNKVGNYTFQFFYGGQTLGNGVIELPSQSKVVTLVVQEEPVVRRAYPVTPLPSEWWQTPVTAENVQLWYTLCKPWLGYGTVTFARTGGYNVSGNYNPGTPSVLSGHVLWTKAWCGGGLSGLSGDQESGHYWSTSQYWPKFAPVIINGILYSTWYSATTGYQNGIIAIDIYTGETLWIINTTNPLRCGMVTQWYTANTYGAIGPYIWTIGSLPGIYTKPGSTQWNMYDGFTGTYVLSIVNGTNPTLMEDSKGNIIGYYTNRTVGVMTIYGPAPPFGTQPVKGYVEIKPPPSPPVLVCWNMSQALGQSWGWAPSRGTVIDWGKGVMWAKYLPNATDIGEPINNGKPNNPYMSITGITNNAVVLVSGFTLGPGTGNEQNGWLVFGAMDAKTGDILWVNNFTATEIDALQPFTRVTISVWDGLIQILNLGVNWKLWAVDARTGTIKWHTKLVGDHGSEPNIWNGPGGIAARNGPGITIYEGFGGDIWCINNTNGEIKWYTNTTKLLGDPGIETPWGIWPLWVFNCHAVTNEVAYLPVGHEYNPPLFHGAQMLAINLTDGSLIWKELGTYVESTSIAYGILISRNCYDNMIYAFGRGPSATTISAPSTACVGTWINIRGTVIDISPGTRYLTRPDVTKTKQNEVALRFPNGVPCVSDECQSKFMEYVYQQQPYPENVTGVWVSFDAIAPNGTWIHIGGTHTNAYGEYAIPWNPPSEGLWTLIITFPGSKSYYPSYAQTTIFVTGQPTAPAAPAYTTMDIAIITAVLIAIVIGVYSIYDHRKLLKK